MGKGGGGGKKVGSRGIQAAMGYAAPSAGPRRMMFRQLASALATGGGKGFRMPLVQQAMARSTSAGQAALRGASTQLAGVDPSIRGRIINRLNQANLSATKAIPISAAGTMIRGAPEVVTGAAGPIQAGFGNYAAGLQSSLQAQATRVAGYSKLAEGLTEAAGTGAGAWYDKYYKKPTTATTSPYGPFAGGYKFPTG